MPKRKENSPRLRQASVAAIDDDCEIIAGDTENGKHSAAISVNKEDKEGVSFLFRKGYVCR